MTDVSFIALEIREVGESVFSNSQDLFLLLNLKASNDVEAITKIRHGLNLVENILSILTYLSTLDLEILDRHEELMNEVSKIKYSCHELQTALSKTMENGRPTIYNKKYLGKLLIAIKNSANKIITISYLLEKSYHGNDIESWTEEYDNVCYENRQTCEQFCSNGFCVEDKAQTTEKRDSNCPEYIETFTESALTHVENGYVENEHMPWHVTTENINIDSEKEKKKYSIWDILNRKFSSSKISYQISKSDNININKENNDQDNFSTSDESLVRRYYITDFAPVDESVIENNENTTDEPKPSVMHNETELKNNYEQTGSEYESGILTSANTEIGVDDSPINDESAETTTSSPYSDIITTESYDTTQCNDETTSYSYSEAYTTEPPTTPSYETTTQDMYKLSQDIYQAAQDLSSKSSEISSMSSEISSKSSDISSLVSELNNYEDEELSKKIQGVSKLTQEINSKTSEISSLTSTMSSLASDISSASSDIPSADRHHAFRTTPWQKMSSKSDDLITSAQGIVTAAQDILVKVMEVASATADLKVATAVANMAGQITTKTQRLISEALSIVSKVIELVSVIDS